jgi:hypothetical protein
MTFEEFFKKKRIDLPAFEKAEPALFFEFKTHYEQMGEKSFDHTKKYWFNKIRRQYNLPPEVKTEKPHIENQLAEQTVTDSINELNIPVPKLGFVPKFKAAGMPKHADPQPADQKNEEAPASTPKPGFTPRFKPEMASKPTDDGPVEGKKEEASAPSPKPGFTPRFKAANMPKPEGKPSEEKKEEAPAEKPKLGFTPKFKAPPKPPEE